MTTSALRQLLLTVIACGITAAIVLFMQYQAQKKIGVVDAIALFNGYKMKIEMEVQSAGQLKYLAGQVDSLKKELVARNGNAETLKSENAQLYQSFNRAKVLWEQRFKENNESINEQVWKRLNPLIDEFGKANGYHLIIGANGMGSVLYNDSYYEQTKEVIDFVNKKYESGN